MAPSARCCCRASSEDSVVYRARCCVWFACMKRISNPEPNLYFKPTHQPRARRCFKHYLGQTLKGMACTMGRIGLIDGERDASSASTIGRTNTQTENPRGCQSEGPPLPYIKPLQIYHATPEHVTANHSSHTKDQRYPALTCIKTA